METRANYAIIGIFTIAVIMAGFGFVYWFSGSETGAKRTAYQVDFTTSVAGLSKGASVLFNGIRVGEVTNVYFDVNQPSKAFARIEVQPDTPVRDDTKAALDVQLLSGAAVISLSGGSAPKLEKKADQELPTIVAERGGIGSLLETARNTADEATRLLVSLNGIVEGNRGTITSTLGNLQTFSQALSDNAPAVNEALSSVGDAAKRIGPLALKLETLADQTTALVRAVEPARVGQIVRNVEDVSKVIVDNRGRIATMITDAADLAYRLSAAAPKVDTVLTSFNAAAESVAPVANRLGVLADEARGLIRAVEPTRVARIVENVDGVMTTVGENRERVAETLRNAASLTGRLNESAPKLDGLIATFNAAGEAIAPAVTTIGTLAADARNVVKAIEPARVTRIVENVDGVLGENRERVARIVGNVDGVMTTLGEGRERVAEVLRNAASLTGRLNESAPKLDGVLAAFNTAAESVAPVANRLGAVADDARNLVRSIEPARVTRIVENVEGVLTENRERVSRIVGNLDGVMATVGENRERVAEVLRNTASLSGRLNDAAPKLDGVLTSFNAAAGAVAPVAARLGTLAEDARNVVRSVDTTRVARIVENVDGVMATVGENRERVSEVLRNTASLTGRLNETAPKIDGFMTTLARVAENLNPLSAKLSTLTDSVATRVQSLDPAQLRQIVANANQFMGGLSATTPEVQSAVRNANQLTGKLNASADRIDGLLKAAQDFLGSAGGKNGAGSTFEAVRTAAIAFQKASENLDRRATEIAQGVSRFSGVGSRQVEGLGTDARRAVNEVGRAAKNLERNPSSVIFGSGRPSIPEYGGR